jgi:hypothetical protein
MIGENHRLCRGVCMKIITFSSFSMRRGGFCPCSVRFREWEYQHHLKDHLGNTRVSFTTKPQTIQFDATFETENATSEEQLFSNIPVTRVTFLAADANSDGGNEVVRLNGTQTNYGCSKVEPPLTPPKPPAMHY